MSGRRSGCDQAAAPLRNEHLPALSHDGSTDHAYRSDFWLFVFGSTDLSYLAYFWLLVFLVPLISCIAWIIGSAYRSCRLIIYRPAERGSGQGRQGMSGIFFVL